MSDLPAPEPPTNPETEAYWQATTEDRLLFRQCADCGEISHPPRTICPDCFSENTTWIDSSGRGQIYSYTVIRQARGDYGDVTPYVLAYVELEEGPRMVTNVVECDPDTLDVGMPVEVVFDPASEDASLPRFRPV